MKLKGLAMKKIVVAVVVLVIIVLGIVSIAMFSQPDSSTASDAGLFAPAAQEAGEAVGSVDAEG